MAEDGNTDGANKLVAGEFENWGNGRFGRLGVSGDWGIRGFPEFGRFRRFARLGGSGDWKLLEFGRFRR